MHSICIANFLPVWLFAISHTPADSPISHICFLQAAEPLDNRQISPLTSSSSTFPPPPLLFVIFPVQQLACFEKHTFRRDAKSRVTTSQLSRDSYVCQQISSCCRLDRFLRPQCLCLMGFRQSLGIIYMSCDLVYYYAGSILCFSRGTRSYFKPHDISYPSILHPRDCIPSGSHWALCPSVRCVPGKHFQHSHTVTSLYSWQRSGRLHGYRLLAPT